MTDSDLLTVGSGYVIDGNTEDHSDRIMVLSTGAVLYRNTSGVLTATSLTRVEVNIIDAEWCLLDAVIEAAEEAPPNCDKCEDDPSLRAKMNPPICPKCGKGT